MHCESWKCGNVVKMMVWARQEFTETCSSVSWRLAENRRGQSLRKQDVKE